MLFAFISRMESSPWGGSEELWSQTAMRLRSLGHDVLVSVRGWKGAELPRMRELESLGVVVSYRYPDSLPPLWRRGLRKIRGRLFRFEKPDWVEGLACRKPDFLLISEPGNGLPKDLCHAFVSKGIPFALVMHAVAEDWWPTDYHAEKAPYVYEHAKAIYFVSEGNRRLARAQYAADPPRAEVVRNPFSVDHDVNLPWPEDSGGWKLAFVGRLEPQAKGCDILLDVLSAPKWRSRNVIVSFYGDGRSAKSVRKYAGLLELANVRFLGHVNDIAGIWNENHLLVLPSRFEGLPIAIVEAMLCRRPCVVTDVGGNAELIEDGVTGFVSEAATARHFDEAMERAWSVRNQWREIGLRAGIKVRESIPRDPVGIFAGKLIELASSGNRPG